MLFNRSIRFRFEIAFERIPHVDRMLCWIAGYSQMETLIWVRSVPKHTVIIRKFETNQTAIDGNEFQNYEEKPKNEEKKSYEQKPKQIKIKREQWYNRYKRNRETNGSKIFENSFQFEIWMCTNKMFSKIKCMFCVSFVPFELIFVCQNV